MKTIRLDREVLQDLYGGSSESMTEIFSDFLSSYPEIKKTLNAAFQSGNINTLKRVLHFHGPTFLYLGIPEVTEMFKELEKKCLQVDNHYLLTKEFEELMLIVEKSCQEAKIEMEYLKKAV